ncbi:MAG: hypothetical protein R2850_00575 [Bacteroidia bacterium]
MRVIISAVILLFTAQLHAQNKGKRPVLAEPVQQDSLSKKPLQHFSSGASLLEPEREQSLDTELQQGAHTRPGAQPVRKEEEQ